MTTVYHSASKREWQDSEPKPIRHHDFLPSGRETAKTIKELDPSVTSQIIQTFSIFSLYEAVTQTSTGYIVSFQCYTGTGVISVLQDSHRTHIPEISMLHGMMWLHAIMVN